MARIFDSLDKSGAEAAGDSYHAASVKLAAVELAAPAAASVMAAAPGSGVSLLTVSGEVRVNATAAGVQWQPSITTLADGSYVVVWTGDGSNVINGTTYNETNIYSQKYTAAGVKIGTTQVFSSDRVGNAFRPSVVGDDAGGYWVYYTDLNTVSSQYTFFYRVHLDAANAVIAAPVPATIVYGSLEPTGISIPSARTAMLSGGGHVFVFQSDSTTPGNFNIYFYITNADGTISGFSATRPNSTTAGVQSLPDVAGLTDGGFVVTWTSEGQDGSDYGIYSQRYTEYGAPVGVETQVNTTTLNYQYAPVIAGLSDGGYVIAWMSYGQDGSAYGIFAQRYDSAGVKVGGEFQVNSYTPGDQSVPDITALSDGGFVVTWISGGDIKGQRFDASAHAIGPEIAVNAYTTNDQINPVITALDGGGFVIAWQSLGQDGSNWGVYQKVFAPATTLSGGQQLYGTEEGDRLDGGVGSDTMYGGYGDDTYVVGSAGDSVVEAAGQGTDLVESAVTFVLGAEVEYLTLTGLSAINGTGNGVANILTGNSAANQLVGGGGNDTVMGGLGDDTLYGDEGLDLLNGGDGNDILYGGIGSDTFDGGNGNDVMLDSSGNDYMSGGAGNDEMSGGIQNDSLYGGDGDDTLYGVDDNDVLYCGDGNDSLDGGEGYNDLYGGAGRDTLSGGVQNDAMSGGDGDDLILASMGQDTVSGDSGFDTFSAQDYIQAVTISLAELSMTDAYDNVTVLKSIENITGSAFGDTLTGDAAGNVIDGGGGVDTLTGGAGHDTYVVDDVNDVIVELSGGGTDLVVSSVSYTLVPNVENLTLTGRFDIDGRGNSAANILTGNGGNNILDGKTGADRMVGLQGDDTYVVDNAGDVVVEGFDEGLDVVRTSVSYVLAANVENLELTGTAGSGTGNAGHNNLLGNASANQLYGLDGNDTIDGGTGNDYIDGGTGADSLIGGTGNDSFVVDNAGDVIVELSGGGGTDTVLTGMTYTLQANLENLTLTGVGNVNGSGNSAVNILSGNAGNNVLDGKTGNDVINGFGGNDTLIGGTGADAFVFTLGSGVDTINDFNATDNDTINLNAYSNGVVNGGGIVITQSGANVLIDLGGGNKITVIGAAASAAAFQSHIVW